MPADYPAETQKTMSFANVQNLAIDQGPLHRLFGICDLEIRTAGGGGGSDAHGHKQELGESLHLDYFRGIDNAQDFRGNILTHLRKRKDAGLGDPDQAHLAERPESGARGGDVEVRRAVAVLLAEARGLRGAWDRG